MSIGDETIDGYRMGCRARSSPAVVSAVSAVSVVSVVTRAAGTRVDQYELLEHLADGAQAEVHRAKDTRTGQEVVLKFPHARTLDHPALAARWRREAALTECLCHPYIQCRGDIGQRHQEPYLVLEYAAGGSLTSWIGPDPLPTTQVVEWGRELAQALAFLHHIGIIHRDVKPGNIVVTDDLTIKLADFGAATHAAKRRPAWAQTPTITEGTAEYISPEQVLGHRADERSDVYSWGVVMYELLTGQVPFTGPDRQAAMTARLTASPQTLSELRPDVPPALEAVVMTALRREPENRYPNSRALLDDLDHLDSLDPGTFDLSTEPVYTARHRPSDDLAMLRFAGIVAAAFVGTVALILALTAALR